MGAPDWNQHEPGQLGVERRDVGYAQAVVDAAADVETLHLEARATGAVDIVELFAGQGAQAAVLPTIYNSLRRPMLVELMDAGSEAWGSLVMNDFSVTAVTGSATIYDENLTQPITPASLNSFDDGRFATSSALNGYIDCQFSTGAFGFDRHVLAVEAWVRTNLTSQVRRYDTASTYVWWKETPVWTPSWAFITHRWGEAITQPSEAFWRPWTPQMVRDFASGGSRKVRVICRAGPGYWRVDRVYLRVYSIPERRLGRGIGSPSAALTWMPVTMDTPAGTGSPTVTAGQDYTLMARRIIDYNADSVASAVLPWRYLRGTADDDTWRRHAQPYNPTVSPGSVGTANLMGPAGAQLDGVPAARFRTGVTVNADTQPYSLSRGALVYGANVVSQTLTVPAGTTTYGQVFVVAGWNQANGRPAAPLRAEVFVDATDVRVLGAVEVTAADVDRLPVSAPVSAADDQGVTYKTVQFRFDDAEDLAAALHRVQFSSPDSLESSPWFVAALISDLVNADESFGGSTDHAEGWWLSDGVLTALDSPGVRSSDLQAVLVEVPPAVTGVAAAAGSLTAHHVEVCDRTPDCEGCAEDTMPYVQVSWSEAPESSPGSPPVAGYHVDRMDQLSPDWERVAFVDGREVVSWNDLEPRIGVTSQYRVRVVRDDGVVGDWSDTVSQNVPLGQVALSFSSNAATGLACVYPEVWTGATASRSWTFREAQDVELRRIHGRNREVAIWPLERRGDGFTRTLLLSAGCVVALPTMNLFTPLRNLSRAAIPYVCVRDGEGNRWYANLRVPEGDTTRAPDNEVWATEVALVEVSDIPAIHDTSVAQVEGPPSL